VLAPSIPGLPLVGNLFEMRRDLVGFLVRIAREFGDVARARQGIFDLVVVSGPDPMHEVLVEKNDAFVKSYALSVFARPLLGDSLLTTEHEAHRTQRRRLAPAFAHKRVAAFADVMAQRAEIASARMLAGRRVDVADEMMRMTLDIVGKALFDADVGGDAERIGEALTKGMQHMVRTLMSVVPVPPQVPTPGNLRALRFKARLDEVVYRLIEQRRRSPADRGDVLSILLARDEDGSLMSDREVRDHVMTLLLAGHETTANALAWALAELARSPSVGERLEAEVDRALGGRTPTFDDLRKLPFALQVFKESLRKHPPAYVMGRVAERPVTVGGLPVKKGQIVLLNVIGMHRRGDLFAAPDRFDPDRFEPEREKEIKAAYVPFGGGPRICIGNQFALMEGQLALAVFGSRMRLELEDRFPEPEPLITLRPKGGLRMHARPRVAA
jgi:cytochrome P450